MAIIGTKWWDTPMWMNLENIISKKARHKGHIVYDSIHIRYPEQANV